MRNRVLLLSGLVLLFVAMSTVQLAAQDVDVSFGASTLLSGKTTTNSDGSFNQTMGGGTFLNAGVNYMIKHNLGAGFDINWRASQNTYTVIAGDTVPFRPILVSFNAIYTRKVTKKIQPELIAGIGFSNTHFYTGETCNYIYCSNYTSSNHFMGDFGGGLRIYVHEGVFIRPEVRVYLINNNTVDFSNNYATRVGMSLGYNFGSPF